MKLSKKLKLKLVEDLMAENSVETLEGFSDNFEKINSVFKESVNGIDSLPIGEYYKKSQILYNSNPKVDDYVGWINLREGRYAPKWQQRHDYEQGDIVISNDNNGHIYECVSSGTSAYTEPLFPTSDGSEIEDLNLVHEWLPEKNYEVGEIVLSTSKTNTYYECVIAGISDVDEPVWGSTVGTTINDNSVVWLVRKTVKWKEAGFSCNFRPFGKIE